MAQIVPAKHFAHLQLYSSGDAKLQRSNSNELTAYSPAQQWQCIAENGPLLRLMHLLLSVVDGCIVATGMLYKHLCTWEVV